MGEYAEGQERRAVYQHVTNLESPWENGPTERSNQVLQMQYSLARDTYEPFSEEENDELIWQCDAARNRHNDRSGFSSAQRLMGVNPRLPRSITSDDIVDPLDAFMAGVSSHPSSRFVPRIPDMFAFTKAWKPRLRLLRRSRIRVAWCAFSMP